MLRVLAADDEAPALEELTYLLRRHPRIEHVEPARDAAEALREIGRMIKSGERLDAVFLDICMPALDGFDFARLAAGFADPPAIVFVTAHDEFAVTAFEFGAVDYILKPIDPGRLAEAVRRVDDAVHRETAPYEPETDEVIPVELGGRTRLISRADVTHAETHGDYIRLHTAGGSYLLRMPLAALEERWRAAGFIRIHRKTLVSAAHITELRFDEGRALVQVGDRLLLPVSRRHTREVRDLLVRRFRQRPERPDE